MEDPPDPFHVDVYDATGHPFHAYPFPTKTGLCDKESLRAHIASTHGLESLSTVPKWMTPICETASPTVYLTHLPGRKSPHKEKRPEVSRKESSHESIPVTFGKGPQLRRSPPIAPSDATVARLGHLSLGQAREEPVENAILRGRESPLSRKRPASLDLQAQDLATDRPHLSGRPIAIRTSIASKYRRSAVEDAPCRLQLDGRLIHSNVESQHIPFACGNDCVQPKTPSPPASNIPYRDPCQDSISPFDLANVKSGSGRGVALEQSSLRVPSSKYFPQPDSKPISHDQLAAEIKGIYAALVMVEAKCIKLDSAHMVGSGKPTNVPHEQWQALIALHRTLLYEHHDFLSASQHPSTNSSLRKLASKYSMPARMWKHGIHSFLEVLRRRLPGSLDYMLQFIYMAYQMVALLYETIPSFQDTWIECLGDLARYRMAIEEQDMRDREIWGGVARDWYSKTSNRNPDVGRLYHHLGILARPNAVQQVYFYCRSLTCVQPFESAMESLSSLISPLAKVESGRPLIPYVDETDALFLYLHATMLCARDSNDGTKHSIMVPTYHSRLDVQIREQALKWKDHGVFIAVTNISACFSYGYSDNFLDRAYRKSYQAEDTSKVDVKLDHPLNLLSHTFAVVLSREKDFNVLPHVHTILAFLWSIYNLAIGEATIIGRILHSIPWGKIVDFLNSFIKSEPIDERIADAGRRGQFLQGMSKDSKPLPEDYLLRGLLWCQDYFVSGWFDEKHDEDSRLLELASTNKVRIERVLRLSICLSQKGDFITFDHTRKEFLKLKH